MLAACGGGDAVIRPIVLTPPPAAPRTDFFVEQADVQSRDVGGEVAPRNEAYGRHLTEALRTALRERGRNVTAPPADVVRSRVYLAYGAAPVKAKGRRIEKASVEVRLQLLDAATGAVLYSTHTSAPLETPAFGWDDADAEGVIRAALEQAARDFASRL